MSEYSNHLPALSILSLDTSLLIPPSPGSISPGSISSGSISPGSFNTSLLFPPHSPSTGSDSASTSCSSNCGSPNISDNEDFFIPMEQQDNVKELLRMFPPPMSATEFIRRNSFQASDGHIKRPSNNFILFRKIAHDQKNQTSALSEYNERQFSQIIGKIWKGLTPDEKAVYKRLGKEVAEMHKELFPKYKYQPKRDKAAWKHFNPENSNSNQKSKRKNNKIKQQKSQETTHELPKIDVNVSQQQQIVPENTLEYTTLIGMDSIDTIYYPESTFTTNNTYMDYFNVNPVNDYSLYECSQNNTFNPNNTYI